MLLVVISSLVLFLQSLFATILAVVAGLTLAGASAVSHDLYANVIKNGQADERQELKVSKITVVILGIVAIGFRYFI